MGQCCHPAHSVSDGWVRGSPEWTGASRATFPGSKAVLIVTVVVCAVTAEEAAVPPGRAAILLSTADLALGSSQEETHLIYTLNCSHRGQLQKFFLVEGWGLHYHQDLQRKLRVAVEFCQQSNQVRASKIKQPRRPLSITSHNTHNTGDIKYTGTHCCRGPLTPGYPGTLTGRQGRFIREHCLCSQECLESIILNIQLIVKDLCQNWKVAVLI